MEFLPTNSLLEFHPNTLISVRKTHGLDAPGHMKELVDELEEWVKNQDHFVKKDFSRHYLETTIISCKGSMEKVKTRLTLICTYRTEKRTYFGNFDIKNDFKEIDGTSYLAFLPKLTKEQWRVLFMKNIGKTFQSNIITQCVRIAIMMLDYMKCHDYSDGTIIIIDLTQVGLFQLLSKLSLRELLHASKILIDAYGLRLKGVYIISSSKIVNTFAWMLKQVVSVKIATRIMVHPNIKSLADIVPMELMPKEYGGNEKSLESLYDDWANMMASQEFRSYMIEMTNSRIKETVEENGNKPVK